MAPPPSPRPRRLPEVIDLVSSDDDESDSEPIAAARTAIPPVIQMDTDSDSDSVRYATPRLLSETPSDVTNQQRRRGGMIMVVDGEEVFIPDEDEPPQRATVHGTNDTNATQDRERAITADTCLQRVLEIFPDISHEFVYNIYNDFDHGGDYETLPGSARLDNIIEQLVSATSYPKQEKGKKRKRQDSIEDDPFQQWERENRIAVPHWLKGSTQAILKAEFPDIPVQYISDTLATQRHLYQTFIALAKTQDTEDQVARPYGKGRPSTKNLANANTIAANPGWPEILDELNAARKRVGLIKQERAAEEIKKLAEQENLRSAIAAGETAECSACFDDLPMNRQIHCNGTKAHFLCFDCAETYIKSEIGESRCRVVCPAADCETGYASHQLNLLSDKQSLVKLAQLQQEKDIRDAGLDDLEECPFCDYKAIAPPVEEDFEFRCANTECEKVSCRRCKAISHIPVSCEQHAKDNKINSRHKIEEAMTAALVRSCNKCKKQFIKEYGCNKMTCPSCGNLQCYVCSATLKDYNHFDQNPGRPLPTAGNTDRSKLCPLYDNVEERHEREVKEAEAKAREQVVEENPDVSVEDLEIKVSEAVKSATANRIRHGGAPGAAYMGWAGPPPPPAMAGVFGLFEAADDDDFDGFGGLHAFRPAPRRPPAAPRRRFQAAHDDLRARIEGARARRQNIFPPPPPPPPPPALQPPAAQPYAPFVPIGGLHPYGAIPMVGYQGFPMYFPPHGGVAPPFAPIAGQPAQQQPAPQLPVPQQPALQQPHAGVGLLRPGMGDGRVAYGVPAANGFLNLNPNPPAAGDRPGRVFNPGN